MSFRLRAVVAGLAATAIVLGTSGIALASAPPYEPDGNSIGGLIFYNSSGSQITSGNIADQPFAAYVQATSPGRSGDTKATLFFASPKNGVAPGAWGNAQVGASPTYPIASGPSALVSSPLPVYTATATDLTLAQGASEFPNTDTSGDGYAGVYQIRLKTSGPGQQAGPTYDAADIVINPTAGTWTEVYSKDAVTATATTLGVTPSSPQTVAGFGGTQPVTLSATVAPAGAVGSVQFVDGATPIGSPVPVASGTGSASATLAVGSHALAAVFQPENSGSTNPVTDPTPAFAPSTSAASAYEVDNPAATATSTALAVNTGSGTAFSPVTFTATVTPAAATGAVTFVDGTATIGTSAAGSATFTFTTSGLTAGPHSVTATFHPSVSGQFAASSSTPPTSFTLGAQLYAPAVGNITASVPAGTLVISTPYTSTAPLDLGPLALTGAGTEFTGTARFGSSGADGITVTDTRSGDLPWTVSALASALTDGGGAQINGENVGLTGVTADPVAGNALSAASVVITDNPAADPAVGPADLGTSGLGNTTHTVASAAQGNGTIGFFGTITLNAPTSTPAGTYAGTITLTIG